MIDRRSFLRSLLGGVAGAMASQEFDLERLLWVPGAQTIFLPPARSRNSFITPNWVTADIVRMWQNEIRLVGLIDRQYDIQV